MTLASALSFTHWGQIDEIAGRRVYQRAEVGLINRNIVIRSGAAAATNGIGGHVMVHAGSLARASRAWSSPTWVRPGASPATRSTST